MNKTTGKDSLKEKKGQQCFENAVLKTSGLLSATRSASSLSEEGEEALKCQCSSGQVNCPTYIMVQSLSLQAKLWGGGVSQL